MREYCQFNIEKRKYCPSGHVSKLFSQCRVYNSLNTLIRIQYTFFNKD